MLSEADFAFVAREVKARAGAVMGRDTNALAESRLAPLARREGYGSVSELITNAKIKPDGKLWAAIADSLIQTETRFFRDRAMFARLRKDMLPELFARRGGERLRVWCAGCGTGQEAYSLAMTLEELRDEGMAGAEVLATDFSERLLGKARSGLYTQFEVQRGLPIRKLIAHFEKAGDLWRISDRLRASVKFQNHNLLSPAGAIGPFDVVLCCNVLSSFDPATRLATLERLSDAMASGGVLILGQGEPLPDGADYFSGAGACFVKTQTKRAA